MATVGDIGTTSSRAPDPITGHLVRFLLEYEVTSVDADGEITGREPLRLAVIDPRPTNDQLNRPPIVPDHKISIASSPDRDSITWVTIPQGKRAAVLAVGNPLSLSR